MFGQSTPFDVSRPTRIKEIGGFRTVQAIVGTVFGVIRLHETELEFFCDAQEDVRIEDVLIDPEDSQAYRVEGSRRFLEHQFRRFTLEKVKMPVVP